MLFNQNTALGSLAPKLHELSWKRISIVFDKDPYWLEEHVRELHNNGITFL